MFDVEVTGNAVERITFLREERKKVFATWEKCDTGELLLNIPFRLHEKP